MKTISKLFGLGMVAALASATPAPLAAKGCIRGAVVGGVAGHYAGHHAVAGAVTGCVAAHYYYKHQAKVEAQKRAAAQGHR